MLTLDAHCDSLYRMNYEKKDFENPKLHINIQNIRTIEPHIQFFACFVDKSETKNNCLIDILKNVDLFNTITNKYCDVLEAAYCYEDIERILEKNKSVGLLWLEGGDAINGEIEILRILYRLGVRGMTLTWNNSNEIASGIEEKSDNGLSKFGREIITEMNNLGMVIDLSHLGELGFWHVLNLTKKPVVATHSNAKGICSHKRNLTDDQIIEIAKCNGVIGINFYPVFLNDSGVANIDDIIKHIEYICALVGSKHIGIGSDFDGIDAVPRGMENITYLEKIFNELSRLNYTTEQMEDIASNNFLRVLKECL